MGQVKTLKDLKYSSHCPQCRVITIDPEELEQEAKRWIVELENQFKEMSFEGLRSSDIAYAATKGMFNLKKIEEQQTRLLKVEMLSKIEWIKTFFNIE